MANSKKALWASQMHEYPKSVYLSVHDMYKWCDAASTPEDTISRYRQISMALQYPRVVFYRIEGTKFMGFRFGVSGHEYMSLYSTEKMEW